MHYIQIANQILYIRPLNDSKNKESSVEFSFYEANHNFKLQSLEIPREINRDYKWCQVMDELDMDQLFEEDEIDLGSFKDEKDIESQQREFKGIFLTMQSLSEQKYSACKVIKLRYDEKTEIG